MIVRDVKIILNVKRETKKLALTYINNVQYYLLTENNEL